MKAVDSIRLFFPLILGGILSLIFSLNLLLKFDGYSDSFTATKNDYESWESKFSSLSPDKKIRIAETIFSEDLNCGMTFENSFKTFNQIISIVAYLLVGTFIVQTLVFLSYLNLERKFINPINRNGVRVVLFINILLTCWAAYLVLAKVGKPIDSEAELGVFLGGVFGLYLTWKIYRGSIYASWALMTLATLSALLVLIEHQYQKLFFISIHMYIAVEAILCSYGLQKET